MSRSASKLRLFVAVYPPLETAQQMLAALDGQSLPQHRIVPAMQVHLTLHFIGDTLLNNLAQTVESVRRSVAGLRSFTMEPVKLIRLPERGDARLIAASLTAHPTLQEIHARLVHRLARQPKERPGRSFLPHMTLCRFARPARLADIDAPIAIEPFPVSDVRLMKSVLQPGGARHDVVESFALHEGS